MGTQAGRGAGGEVVQRNWKRRNRISLSLSLPDTCRLIRCLEWGAKSDRLWAEWFGWRSEDIEGCF